MRRTPPAWLLCLVPLAGCAANPNADAGFYHHGNPHLHDPFVRGLQQRALREEQQEADPSVPLRTTTDAADKARRLLEGVLRLSSLGD